MRNEGGGFAANIYGRCPKVCDSRFPSYRQPSPRGEGAPKGRIGHWRHEREWGNAFQANNVREHPSAAKKEANPASLRSAAPSKGRGSCGHSLLPMEGGAPKGRRLAGDSGIFETKPSPRGEGARKGRIGHWRYEREWGNAFQAGDVRQYPSTDFCKRRCLKVCGWQASRLGFPHIDH